MPEPTLPALAKAIAETFPELEGRSIAVSEVDPFDKSTNIPTLPIAVVALVGETGDGSKVPNLTDDILVHFVFEPVKYKKEDGKDSPFFAFYDYETLRDRMLSLARNWTSPRGSILRYRSLDVESDEFAVYIAMRFGMETRWCEPEELAAKPVPFVITTSVLGAAGKCPPRECPEPEDPCDAARKRNPHGRENWSEGEADDHGPITE